MSEIFECEYVGSPARLKGRRMATVTDDGPLLLLTADEKVSTTYGWTPKPHERDKWEPPAKYTHVWRVPGKWVKRLSDTPSPKPPEVAVGTWWRSTVKGHHVGEYACVSEVSEARSGEKCVWAHWFSASGARVTDHEPRGYSTLPDVWRDSMQPISAPPWANEGEVGMDAVQVGDRFFCCTERSSWVVVEADGDGHGVIRGPLERPEYRQITPKWNLRNIIKWCGDGSWKRLPRSSSPDVVQRDTKPGKVEAVHDFSDPYAVIVVRAAGVKSVVHVCKVCGWPKDRVGEPLTCETRDWRGPDEAASAQLTPFTPVKVEPPAPRPTAFAPGCSATSPVGTVEFVGIRWRRR